MFSPGDILTATAQAAHTWNQFDSNWYRDAYAVDGNVADPLEDYLTRGQGSGRSPNIFFDEAWYLSHYGDVRLAVQAGNFASGFDHYCRTGLQTRSPHWLFDLAFYEAGSPDLSPEALQAGGFVNAYDHFLRVGSREGRPGHPLFNSRHYAELQHEAEPTALDSPFADYLQRLHGKGKDVGTSVYFDPDWYSSTYPQWVGAGEGFLSPLHHYLGRHSAVPYDPLPEFSEQYYLATYPDVAEAVAKGAFPNGYMHYLRKGVFELRNPCSSINLQYYWDHHATVRRAVQTGRVRDAFTHALVAGLRQGLTLAPFQPPPDIPEQQTRGLFTAQAQSLLPLFGRQPIDFSCNEPPICSVIMVLSNSFALSMQSIASLRQNHPGSIELILVDSGSVDDVQQIEEYVRGAKLLRFEENIGFSLACNAGLSCVGADATLFLNSDVRLGPGAIAAALVRLASDAQIGAVGGKVIRSNESLQEAGCIIWADGWTTGYLRDHSPLTPEACFTRDVDFCSAVFVMARTSLLRQLDGFDPAFSPAYFEDADLGLRIWQAGFRVVYDPGIILHHYEYGSSRDPRAAQAMMRVRHEIFQNKHAAILGRRLSPGAASLPFARSVESRRPQVLFIEDTIPLRHLGSGYVRANDIIRVMASLDYHVTVYPVQPTAASLVSLAANFPDMVEVMHDRSVKDLATFLQQRPGYYDCVWISRTHNLDEIRPILEDTTTIPGCVRVILDTEAVTSPRAAQQAALAGVRPSREPQQALQQEFRNVGFCHQVLTVNQLEADLLTELGVQDVRVLGTWRDLTLTPRGWAQRSGMLFLGSLHEMDSPNYDSLCWFVDSVLPLIEAELGYETRLTIAGYVGADVALERFADHPRVTLAGPVAALAAMYDRHRVVVAPTRFAAGTPYKVYEAASFGVPTVVTTLLQQQLGWQDGRELLAAAADDAVSFAAKTVALYRSAALWDNIRNAAAERLLRDNNREAYVQVLKDVLPEVETRRKQFRPEHAR